MHRRTTGEIARLLDVPEYALQNLIRHRIIEPPELVVGRRCWTEDDMDRARNALCERASRRRSMASGKPSRPQP